MRRRRRNNPFHPLPMARLPPASRGTAIMRKRIMPRPTTRLRRISACWAFLPNYRTVNETGVYTAITAKQKLIIASKDSFDYPLVLLGAAFAGISQLDNSDPSYHQGVEGFAKRLAANYADQATR